MLDPDTSEKITRIVDEAAKRSAHPLGRLILQARLKQAARLTEQVMRAEAISRRPWSDRLAATMIHPFWGYPILIAVLLVMYFLVGDLAAQKGVNFFEEVLFGRTIAPLSHWLITHLLPLEILQALFIGEYGLLTMALPYAFAIILPIVGMFFLCFGILEDVGYLPRLAVMADRACRLLGLNGKAVLPLVLGLGCVTMGTMTTRILDSKKERLLATLVLALGIPCSAQLGVILAMLAGQPMLSLLIWMSVVATVVITVGRLCSYWLGGETSFFLYELPPLRKPKLSNILIKTLGRLEWYVKEAVPLFFAGTLALFLLDRTGWLATLESWLEPVVVGWLGLPAKAADALLIGFLRRDFGAAGFFEMQRRGMLDGTQTIVSLVTITLFVPCVAQYFMMIKERGWRTASAIAAVATGIAVGVGGILLRLLRSLPIG
ncbi:MAG: ferrous iron transporter B [Candidatus Omnitrophica bacterium]|nr:ferrous iron transporter B [Candidatus Omnitrophota bacterium]